MLYMTSLSQSLQPSSLGLLSLPLLASLFPLKLQGAGKRRSPCALIFDPFSPQFTWLSWAARPNTAPKARLDLLPLVTQGQCQDLFFVFKNSFRTIPSLSHCITVWVFKVTKIVKRKYIKRNKKPLSSSRRKDT